MGLVLRTTNGVYVCYIKNRWKGIDIKLYQEFITEKKDSYVKLRIKDKLNLQKNEESKVSSVHFIEKLKRYYIY